MGASQSDATYAGITNDDLRRVAGAESFAFDDPIWVSAEHVTRHDPPSLASTAANVTKLGAGLGLRAVLCCSISGHPVPPSEMQRKCSHPVKVSGYHPVTRRLSAGMCHSRHRLRLVGSADKQKMCRAHDLQLPHSLLGFDAAADPLQARVSACDITVPRKTMREALEKVPPPSRSTPHPNRSIRRRTLIALLRRPGRRGRGS